MKRARHVLKKASEFLNPVGTWEAIWRSVRGLGHRRMQLLYPQHPSTEKRTTVPFKELMPRTLFVCCTANETSGASFKMNELAGGPAGRGVPKGFKPRMHVLARTMAWQIAPFDLLPF